MTSEAAAGRIHWIGGKYASYAGYTGTCRAELFSINWKTRHSGPDWSLTSRLPGQEHLRAAGDDKTVLMAVAESWLTEFAVSLGAMFPEV